MSVSPQTRPPQQARTVARASAPAAQHPAAAVLLPGRRPGRLGPVHVTQLLLAEAAVVGVLAALTSNALLAIGVGVAGAVLVLVAFRRQQGRWWLERLVLTRRYRRRRRDATAGPDEGDPRLAALRALAPGLLVENVAVADDTQVGVARDEAGWYAVAAVSPNTTSRDTPAGLPLDLLASALADADQPGTVLQVVTRTVPAPSLGTHPGSPAGQSYRQLLARLGAVPADQETWIAVRLDARSLAEAVATDGVDLDTAPAVVAALVRRAVKPLRRLGISCRPLDADALLGVLLRCCDLEPTQGAEPARPSEEWSEWHSAELAHRSYWIRGWPPLAQASTVLGWLTTAPAAMTNISLVLAPAGDPGMVELSAVVRVAARASELGAVCQSLTDGARQAQTGLFQLDGEQGPAVYASAPTGGGAR